MQLRILQENLSKALSHTSRFASTRAQLPVLANVLLKTKKNKLLISATNLELSISLSIGAKVEKEGEITVPAKTITDLVSNLSTGSINLTTKKEQLKIKTDSFDSVISGMNAADFPDVPVKVGKGSLNLPVDDFVESLDKVLFAASIDETRPVLTGILMIFKKEGKGGSLLMVATDGFRLSQKKVKLGKDVKIKEGEQIILPKSALSELSRLSGEEDIDFSYVAGDNQVIFGTDSAVLSSRIIDGEFPDFEKIIPKESSIKIEVGKEDMLQSVKLASVFARDSANVVKLQVLKDGLKVSAESSQSGKQETDVEASVEKEGGESSFKIAFNYRFIEEFLNSVDGEDVVMEFSDANSPGLFLDPKDNSFLHLIMPVKLQE